jgi:peptide/nickel transport system substrate-binding protein
MCFATLKKYLAVLIGLALAATGLWAAAAEEEPAAAADKEMVLDPSTGKMVTAPEYGGTLTIASGVNVKIFDTALAWPSYNVGGPVVEKLGMVDWAIDRDEYPIIGGFMLPLHAIRGTLAETWEQTDPLTYVFHIRKGIHWHNKAPMNGRELTAKDIEYNFHRYLGLGSGFTEPGPRAGELGRVPLESITATDQYTVVFKLKEPYLRTPILIQDNYSLYMQPPEVIQQHGDVTDWRNVVGTGPFELTDFVDGSSLTYIENPDYWGFDEKFPENRLPYVDELRVLVMPEEATRLAALRSGKIDYTGYHGTAAAITSIDVVESLKRTNPELVRYEYSENRHGFIFNVSKPPFDDIRLRKAMNMAVNMETINNTYFRGYGDTTPTGFLGRAGFYVPFDNWPEEVKDTYRYNPEGAERLFEEAGYPRDADGIRLKTTVYFRDIEDVGFIEAAVASWSEIGVDVTLEVFSIPQWGPYLMDPERPPGFIFHSLGFQADPFDLVARFTPDVEWGPCRCDDPVYNALYERSIAATTFEEQKPLFVEMGMHFIESVWGVPGPEAPQFNVSQPWVKGYDGEGPLGGGDMRSIFSRLWIDQNLKKEMGF